MIFQYIFSLVLSVLFFSASLSSYYSLQYSFLSSSFMVSQHFFPLFLSVFFPSTTFLSVFSIYHYFFFSCSSMVVSPTFQKERETRDRTTVRLEDKETRRQQQIVRKIENRSEFGNIFLIILSPFLFNGLSTLFLIFFFNLYSFQ